MNQTTRVVEYLRDNPGASSLDIIRDLAILNTTGRISDARAEGYQIDAWRARDGVWRFRLVEAPVQQELAL